MKNKHSTILEQITLAKEKGKKLLSVLIDPDTDELILSQMVHEAEKASVDFIFVGGSLLYKGQMEICLEMLQSKTHIPLVIFPGNELQFSNKADAILFLSLISGRNADLLIGKHVQVAPFVKQSGIEVLPTGYMLIDSGKATTASYISQTQPIPYNKPGIAMATAIAGELLGLKLLYMDCGSGAEKPISEEMLHLVRQHCSLPIVVGGGVTTPEQASVLWKSGADMVVLGSVLEKDPSLTSAFTKKRNELSLLS